MRKVFMSSVIVAALLGLASPVSAQPARSDASAAINLCRTTVAQQTGAALDHVRFDEVHQRAHAVLVDLNLWADGKLTNVRCEVARGDTLTVASISPELHSAASATASN